NPTLARRLTQLLGVSVDSIGHVFSVDQARQFEDLARGKHFKPVSAAENKLLDDLRTIQSAGLKLAYCPGPMRVDKGARRVPSMLEAVDSNPQFHLVFQLPSPRFVEVRNLILRSQSPHATLLQHDLSEEAYASLLGMADVVVLPYEAKSYRSRVSAVFAEA